MKNRTGSDRPQGRQAVITKWFARFVEGRAYEQTEHHQFCADVRDKTEAEIRSYYGELV